MLRRLVLGMILMIALSACATQPTPTPAWTPSPTADSLAYHSDPNVLVVDLRARVQGGPPPADSLCDGISHLRIWGDGRALEIIYQEGHRLVSSGYVDPAGLRDILVLLQQQGFFAPWTPAPPNPAGTGYNIQVNLKAGTFSYFGAPVGPLHTRLQPIIDSLDLTPFIPVQALLIVTPYDQNQRPAGPLPEWPSHRYGFALTEVPRDGRWIEGDVLAFVWQTVNEHNVPRTGFHEDGKDYAVSLQIPGLLELPFDACE